MRQLPADIAFIRHIATQSNRAPTNFIPIARHFANYILFEMATACDFEVVTIGKKHKGGQRSKEAVNAAMRTGGDVATEKKFSAGSNKQSSANKNTAKLDRETDELHHEHVSLDVAKLIQCSRQNKGFTQKELATKINEKPQVINEYESGKAIPNQQVFGKLERVLGVKLRGKDKGKPFGAGPKK